MLSNVNEQNIKQFFQRRYIIVTPCRDEERNLQNLINSMSSQSVKPILWVIVDDGSTDRTGEIIADAERKYDWINGIYLKEKKDYLGTHYAHVFNKGFEFAKDYCKKNKMHYEYIALVDADNIPEQEYFEKLIHKFEENMELGIASGINAYAEIEKLLKKLKEKNPNATVMDQKFWQMWDSPLTSVSKNRRDDLPMGSARMWRKKCFEDTGGYLKALSPDSVSNIKAKLRGWETRCFKNIKVIERRAQVKEGLWEGNKQLGENNYFRGLPLYFACLKAVKYSFGSPYYLGIAYFFGYIKSIILRKERISDEEIRKYYQYTRPQELKDIYKKKFKFFLVKLRVILHLQ